jgi:putative acetyltransferase
MNPLTISPITDNAFYDPLRAVWAASVQATHTFLHPCYHHQMYDAFPGYLPHVSIYAAWAPDGSIAGFSGIAADKVEMLFVHHQYFGCGVGYSLLHHAVTEMYANSVDVNEQNTQATQFYLRYGFRIVGRSATDAAGKPYPILHLSL